MQKRFVHETADQCFWIAFFGSNDFYDFSASLVKDGVTLRKCYLFSFWKLYDRFFLYYISADKPQSSLSLKSIVTVELAAQNAHWSNFTSQCNANVFVKVDAQIEEECRRTSLWTGSLFGEKNSNSLLDQRPVHRLRRTTSYLQGYSCPKRHCKKLSTIRNTRRTT